MKGVMFSDNFAILCAIILLSFMGAAAIFSLAGDSATRDELAHLPAGYSYLTQQDMRLNPEHPPLIKDLAALPLIFINNIVFPANANSWTKELNGQWGFGEEFLYHSGNPADKMIFWGRIPMVFVMLFLGAFLFFWIRKLLGIKVALLTLFLYSFSPTIVAHGRLITTDVGAALGLVVATYFFLRFLENPSGTNVVFAGIAFAFAQLLKFNLILLYPFFLLLTIFWTITKVSEHKLKNFFLLVAKLILLIAVAWVLIWFIYAFHTKNLPRDLQLRYVEIFTQGHPAGKLLIPFTAFLSQYELLRPWGYYMLGVDMATQRASGGHTTYFMGELSASGWISYFPIVYIIKEPLAFHLLTIAALLFVALSIKKPFWRTGLQQIKEWIADHFTQFAMILWLAIYWFASLSSNLNIGMRHLIPLLPFTYALVAWTTIQWLSSGEEKFKKMKIVFMASLLLWQAGTMIKVYPNFLSYFNELAGGPAGGSRYVVDSNLDWGQDLKRLVRYVTENNIKKIKVAYFGGGDPQYYMEERVEYFQWEKPQKGWVAVSASLLRGGQAIPAPGFNNPTDQFFWLLPYTPVTVIGNSIFVYYIP